MCRFSLKINPQHTVPTLDDNGKYIWDSHAISTYLIGKYGKSEDHPLYPKDLYVRARIDQRLHFETGILFHAFITAIRAILLEKVSEISEKNRNAIQEAYATLETFLAVDPYLVGNELTVADLSVITTLTQTLLLVPLDEAKFPKVAAWVKRLETLPYFHDINTVELVRVQNLMKERFAQNKAAAQQ